MIELIKVGLGENVLQRAFAVDGSRRGRLIEIQRELLRTSDFVSSREGIGEFRRTIERAGDDAMDVPRGRASVIFPVKHELATNTTIRPTVLINRRDSFGSRHCISSGDCASSTPWEWPKQGSANASGISGFRNRYRPYSFLVTSIESRLPQVPPTVIPKPAAQDLAFLSSIINRAKRNDCAENKVSVSAVQP